MSGYRPVNPETRPPLSDSHTTPAGPSTPERRLSGGALIVAVVAAALLLLSWSALQRHADAARQHAQLVEATGRSAAREIAMELAELRRSVRSLAVSEQNRIQQVARTPEDIDAFEALSAVVRANFSDAFAITIADSDGRELVDNFEGEIEEVCRKDIAAFAASVEPVAALIHPNPIGYHFDITVPADLGTEQGVLFVSFRPDRISRLLRRNALEGYNIYLIKTGDSRGLIELTDEGSRNHLERDFFLSQDERARISDRIPVPRTQWDLVLVHDPDHADSVVSKSAKEAAASMGLLLLIGGFAAWRVQSAQRQISARDQRLQDQAAELSHSEHRLQMLHRTTSSPDLGLAAKIDSLLQMGLQEFGLELGIVSRIQGERYEVLYTLSHDHRLEPGTVFALGDTYCRHMLATGDAVGIAHVGASAWRSHPCYANFGLESYIGAPIVVRREVVGTLNFSSTTPRTLPFTERDLDLLRIMARWVGMEIEREESERRQRHSEGYLQSIINTVADAILTVDASGRVTTSNRAASQIFGHDDAQLLGRNVRTLLPELAEEYYEPQDTGAVRITWGRHRDGSSFPVELSINRMCGTDKPNFTAVIRDISERRSAEEKLNLSHRLLEAVSTAQSRYIAEDGEVLDSLLENLLELTASGSGFIAEVWTDEDGSAQSQCWASIGASEEDFSDLSSEVLRLGVIRADDNREGTAEVRLCAPIHHGNRLVGLVGLATRHGSYSAEVGAFIEPLLAACGNLIQAYRSDQRLRESTQMQAAILRTTRYMIIATDPEGIIVSFNQAAEQTLGYAAEELIGKHTPAVFHDSAEMAERARSLSLELGEPIEPCFEVFVHKARAGGSEERVWQYVRKDGRSISVLLAVNALTDHTGEITGFLGVAKDITEQLAAEETIRRSQAKLADAEERSRLLLDSAGDGIYGLDNQGRTVFVNPAAARMLGYTPDELIGSNMHALVHHTHADGSTYAREDCPMSAAYRNGVVQRVTGEVLWRKDGSSFPVEYTSTPIRKDDTVVGAVVIFKDVTEARAAELALRRSEARLAEAQRIAHLGSWEWDVQTNQTYWSDETFRIYGYEPRAFEPDFARFASHIHPDDRQRVFDALAAAAAGGTLFECGYRIITAGGVERDVNDRGQCVVDAQGATLSMVGIVQDVTEQRKVDRLKSEFVSTVSHELRTPLTSIRGSLGLLSGSMSDQVPEKARDLIAIAQRNSERLLLLINDILDLSKIESGRLAFRMRELELVPFLRHAIAANQGYADEYHVEMKLIEPDSEVWIHADPDRLMQVMANLLSNAAKFSPPGGKIEIEAKVQNERASIRVRDFGEGIPAEFQDRVFDRFCQADGSDTRQSGGTGLGLSISKAIVERHGGNIGFQTSDRGTTFYFDLAMLQPAHAGSTAPSRDDPNYRGRVLVCEDDRDAAQLIALMLREHNYDAEIAHSAAAARSLLAERTYRALTLDIRLPDGDGLQLLQDLRRDPATQQLPVIIVSAVADTARSSLNGSAIGVLDWLDKPIDHGRLTAALRRIETEAPVRKPRVLHVEDDDDICAIVRLLIKDHAEVEQAVDVAAARRLIAGQSFDLVLLDLELPDGSGLELLDDLAAYAPEAPAVVFSASELEESMQGSVYRAFVKARTSDRELRETLLAALACCRDYG